MVVRLLSVCALQESVPGVIKISAKRIETDETSNDGHGFGCFDTVAGTGRAKQLAGCARITEDRPTIATRDAWGGATARASV